MGISSSQSLHHFLANSPWLVSQLKERRLALTLEALKEQKITVVIDEARDRKKGKKTDYVRLCSQAVFGECWKDRQWHNVG